MFVSDSASEQHRSVFIICIETLGHGEIFVFCLFVVRSPPEYKIWKKLLVIVIRHVNNTINILDTEKLMRRGR